MGQARLKRLAQLPTVYHHTSTLRTNMIWMSGVIELEGRGGDVIHPHIGTITTDARMRRAMRDFPPLAWFTTKLDVPKCLQAGDIYVQDKATGATQPRRLTAEESNAFALRRLALGFGVTAISAVHWPEHPGYATDEGRELNETAIEAGDNPGDWYVSETPVDVMLMSEVWVARGIFNTKMQRDDRYLPDVKAMVSLCRSTPGVYIPPAWLSREQAAMLSQKIGVLSVSASNLAL